MFVSRAERRISRAVDVDVARIGAGARAEATRSCLLDRYIEGWAEANPCKILAATANEYCFDDPLVGPFSRWSIAAYHERLRSSFARGATIAAQDLAVFVRGPMGGSRESGRVMFFREVPSLGLSGVTFITLGERGVVGETVVYDLNLASDVLRHRA